MDLEEVQEVIEMNAFVVHLVIFVEFNEVSEFQRVSSKLWRLVWMGTFN